MSTAVLSVLGSTGLVGLLGWVLALYYRSRLQTAEKQDEIDSGRADKASSDLTAVRVADTDRIARLEAENGSLRTVNIQMSRRMADLARGNPELAREFLRGVLQEASDSGSGHAAAPVPPPGSAGVAGGDPGGHSKR